MLTSAGPRWFCPFCLRPVAAKPSALQGFLRAAAGYVGFVHLQFGKLKTATCHKGAQKFVPAATAAARPCQCRASSAAHRRMPALTLAIPASQPLVHLAFALLQTRWSSLSIWTVVEIVACKVAPVTRHCGTCCLKNLSPMRCASARFMICIPRGHARRLHHSTHYSDIISTLPSRSWHFKS